MDSTAITAVSPVPPPQTMSLWNTMQSLVLDGLSSPHTRRAYGQALEEFLIWLCSDSTRRFTKATVQKYRVELQGNVAGGVGMQH